MLLFTAMPFPVTRQLFFLFLTSLCFSLSVAAETITVELNSPIYQNNTLTTTNGGIVTSPGIRIQALNISYTQDDLTDPPTSYLEADGQLLVIYKKRQFTGKKLKYDFQNKKGVIYDGRLTIGPWFLGGEKILLKPEGRFSIREGFLTTCESEDSDWQIRSSQIDVIKDDYIKAKWVQFRFLRLPVFWLPNYRAKLKTLSDIPVKVKFSVGGTPGARALFRYRVFDWNDWKVYLRLDLLLKRGLGGGIESDYITPNHDTRFSTRNYLAHERSMDDPKIRLRYRFHGIYRQDIPEHKLKLHGSYDKLSDSEMASDYSYHSFDLPTAKMTYFTVNKRSSTWLADCTTRLRINSFQVINQELPSIISIWRPLSMGNSGIISDTRLQGAYLDYTSSNELSSGRSFQSARTQATQTFMRPFALKTLHLLPLAGATGIFYSNSPDRKTKESALVFAGISATSSFYKTWEQKKHLIVPSASYFVGAGPSSEFDNHYIFSIQDGFAPIHQLRLGLKNILYTKAKQDPFPIRNLFEADLYAYAFFHTTTMPKKVPKVYLNIDFSPTKCLTWSLRSAWNNETSSLDHTNIGLGWTKSEDFAMNLDFLHRNAYDWRKSQHENFILDLSVPLQELRESGLSDRRDTVLYRFFYRLNPSWSLQLQSRYGFHRVGQPNYLEFKIDLFTALKCNWIMRFTIDHRQSAAKYGDNRFSMNFDLGSKGSSHHHHDAAIW